ncbi:D-alanyl-D-alanine carboxypeptidase family protein [Clostridium aminobutyricum]|uniref:D-alanyl-D-alanine carboxypeptidase n=1 Tax=Clostridium aminobutyricum TaxID=33953 RepID=A0A939D991_CLOAM|nr:D-alanyl-D-alanine carboxypeptidase family protein [Clostridium aminobutyricum]MBN7773058.1 D-alanyl-D-alanine carboxypeptidase [Clostridium aminobutyricum]
MMGKKNLKIPLSIWDIVCGILIIAAVSMLVLTVAEVPGKIAATMNRTVPSISANQAVLMDGTSGEILYEKNAETKAYPASTTKIMTALLTIERVEELHSDLTQKVKIPADAVGVEGSSIYLAPGEAVSIEDLLYGLMLRSGNDAAVALADIIGGNQEHFAEMMNERAQELGCKGTNFLNPNGLYDDNHYTTAYDMALIAKEAMKNETFRRISAAESWEASREPDKYNYFYNKNKVVHQYEGGNGVKIGYTKASGRTLVASAERDGRLMICVVMGAPDWFNDAYALMNYGFEADESF